MEGFTAASSRLWRRVGQAGREAFVRGFDAAELRTVLADVARSRASDVTPADLMRRWQEDRLVGPQSSHHREVHALLGRCWAGLPPEFEVIDPSPLVPLGTGQALGSMGQNRIVTTMRFNELVVDPAHALALEASRRRRAGRTHVHLASAGRAFAPAHAPAASHEARLTLLSSAPDSGGLGTEAALLPLHLGFWTRILQSYGGELQLSVWDDTLAGRLGDLPDTVTRGNGDARTLWPRPYGTAAFAMLLRDGTAVGDGGFVNWTQQLTRNRKDRCLVSSLELDELAGVYAD